MNTTNAQSDALREKVQGWHDALPDTEDYHFARLAYRQVLAALASSPAPLGEAVLLPADVLSAMKVAQLGTAWDVAIEAKTAARNKRREVVDAWKSESGDDYYTPFSPEEADPAVEAALLAVCDASHAATVARRRLRNAIRVHRQFAAMSSQERHEAQGAER